MPILLPRGRGITAAQLFWAYFSIMAHLLTTLADLHKAVHISETRGRGGVALELEWWVAADRATESLPVRTGKTSSLGQRTTSRALWNAGKKTSSEKAVTPDPVSRTVGEDSESSASLSNLEKVAKTKTMWAGSVSKKSADRFDSEDDYDFCVPLDTI